jgi:hypothetical protein
MGEGHSHLLLAAVAVAGLYLLVRRLSANRPVESDGALHRPRYQIPRLGQARPLSHAAAEEPWGPARLEDAPPELARWQVAMHELARDLKGEIDTKLAALQTLVALARQEAARLEALLAQTQRLAHVDAAHVSASGHAPSAAPSLASEPGTARAADEASVATPKTACQPDTLARLADLADPAAMADPAALANAARTLPPPSAADPLADNAIDLAIARLTDQGHPAEEIARQLGLPLGEVELRQSLRPRN